jgi:hypothetical protein
LRLRPLAGLVAVLGMMIAALAGAATASAAAPAAVDPQIANGAAQQQLDAAKADFQQAGIGDYHFSVERLCFCAPAFRGPAAIVVRNGAALSPPPEFEELSTVPKLHAVVQEAIDDEVEKLTVQYDANGVPLSIFVDVSAGFIDDEITYRVTNFVVDHPKAWARGDLALHLQWKGPDGNATRTLICRDGVLLTAWPDAAVCTRLLAAPSLAEPITIETRDLRVTRDPRLFTAVGHVEGRFLAFAWRGQGSSTRLGRLRAWETALGADAIATVRGS